MKRMEEEMNKFRSELINRESSSFRKAASRCANNLLIIPNYLISNSKSSLSSIWKTSYSKTVHSSSESRTIIDGKEVEGSKTSYSARSLLVRFPNCHGASGFGNLTRSLLLLENFFLKPSDPHLSKVWGHQSCSKFCFLWKLQNKKQLPRTFCKWLWVSKTFLHSKNRALTRWILKVKARLAATHDLHISWWLFIISLFRL